MKFKTFLYEAATKPTDKTRKLIRQLDMVIQQKKVLEALVKSLKTKHEELESELQPIITKTHGQQVMLKGILAQIKGKNSTSRPYKDAFEMALTKVDQSVQEELRTYLDSISKIERDVPYVDIVSVDGSAFTQRVKAAKTPEQLIDLAKEVLDLQEKVEEDVKQKVGALIKRIKSWVGKLASKLSGKMDATEENLLALNDQLAHQHDDQLDESKSALEDYAKALKDNKIKFTRASVDAGDKEFPGLHIDPYVVYVYVDDKGTAWLEKGNGKGIEIDNPKDMLGELDKVHPSKWVTYYLADMKPFAARLEDEFDSSWFDGSAPNVRWDDNASGKSIRVPVNSSYARKIEATLEKLAGKSAAARILKKARVYSK
jgi:hypothetical protein